MSRLRRPRRRHIVSAVKWGALGTLAVQTAAVATVTAIDAMRKRRSPQSGNFPHLPPQETVVGPNEMTVYTYGRDLYDAMLEDIRSATDHIYFECFIVKADETGFEFRDALIDAARFPTIAAGQQRSRELGDLFAWTMGRLIDGLLSSEEL